MTAHRRGGSTREVCRAKCALGVVAQRGCSLFCRRVGARYPLSSSVLRPVMVAKMRKVGVPASDKGLVCRFD